MNKDPNFSRSNRLDDPVNLLFETSPFGTIDAIVEHDGLAVYFYLNGRGKEGEKFGTRACWVRNLGPGPFVINADEMQQGIPPMMPKTHCKVRTDYVPPDPQSLSVVWFEEGNGAALIETDEQGSPTTLAVIPPWSGLEGFHGYSEECSSESPLAWPMPRKETLHLRIERAQEFWTMLREDDPFSVLQPELLARMDARFAHDFRGDKMNRGYYAIDGGQFPPRGLVEYRSENELIMVTIAMSMVPQPSVEIFTNDPSLWRRIELGIRYRGELDDQIVEKFGMQISGLAGFPWRNFTWFGPGHTCSFGDAIPGSPFVLMVHDHRMKVSVDSQELPGFRGDPINLLWMIPITEQQQNQLEAKEITADDIIRASHFEA